MSAAAPEQRLLAPRVATLWIISGLARNLGVLAVIGAILFVVDRTGRVELAPVVFVILGVIAVASVPMQIAYSRLAYRRWSYRLGDIGLETASGVWWRRSAAMPYHRLQQVDIAQGPLQRRLRISSVQLRSAAATTDAVLPGVDDREVDALRRLLLERAGHDDGA